MFLSRMTTLFIGVGLGLLLARVPVPSASAAKAAKPAPVAWRRVVVALKLPLTPSVARELKKTFGARMVPMTMGHTYCSILLRPGETLANLKAKSPAIAFVEPEVVMSIPAGASGGMFVLTPEAEKKP